MTTFKKITHRIVYFSLFIIHCSLFIFLSSCHRNSKDLIVITPKIQYDVSISNKAPDMDWWVQNIEGPERDAFLRKLYDAVSSGKLKTFDYNTDAQLTNDNIQHSEFNIQNLKFITKLRFLEKWIINKSTAEVYKKVIAVCPLLSKDSSYIPLFRIKLDTTQNILHAVSNIKKSALISQRIRYDVFINNQKNQAGARLQRVPHDTLQNNDWWFDNIEPSNRLNFIDIILNTALSGKSRLYDYFESTVSSIQLKNGLYHTDTLTVPNPAHPENNKDTTIITHKDFDKNSIAKIRFMEEWYFDNKTYNFTKKIAWISPMEAVFDATTGEFRGYRELFRIYFDKKYPLKTDKN